MHLPRVRLTVRDTMALIALTSILLAWAMQVERLRRQKWWLMNQNITVSGAEANYRNAGLRRQAAEASVARHIARYLDDDKNPTLKALKDAVTHAHLAELDLEQRWNEEKNKLSRMIGEFYHSRY